MVAKAAKQENEEEMNVLCNKPDVLFKFVKFIRKNGKDMHAGGGMDNVPSKSLLSARNGRPCELQEKICAENLKK